MRIFILLALLGWVTGTGYAATDAENRTNFIKALDLVREGLTNLNSLGDDPLEEHFKAAVNIISEGVKAGQKVDKVFLNRVHPGLETAFNGFIGGYGSYVLGLRMYDEKFQASSEKMIDEKWRPFWRDNAAAVLRRLGVPEK